MPLDQTTGDPGGRCALPGWDDDAHAVVTTSPHGATPGVDHEAHQEPDEEWKGRETEKEETKNDRRQGSNPPMKPRAQSVKVRKREGDIKRKVNTK